MNRATVKLEVQLVLEVEYTIQQAERDVGIMESYPEWSLKHIRFAHEGAPWLEVNEVFEYQLAQAAGMLIDEAIVDNENG